MIVFAVLVLVGERICVDEEANFRIIVGMKMLKIGEIHDFAVNFYLEELKYSMTEAISISFSW